mgnify:CR=1 FL=1
MLQSDDDMTKSFGAQIVAASTDSRKRKRYERAAACYLHRCNEESVEFRHYQDLQVVEHLLALIRHTRSPATAKHALGALVNLTTEREMQAAVVRNGIHLVFQFARVDEYPMCKVYATKIIDNAKHNPVNRTELYKCELYYRTWDWRQHEGLLCHVGCVLLALFTCTCLVHSGAPFSKPLCRRTHGLFNSCAAYPSPPRRTASA